MTGKGFLDFIVGISGQYGMADKNPNDVNFRAFALQCLNLVGKDIQTRQTAWHWRFLEKTSTTNTVALQMDYDLPTDIDSNKLFGVYDRTDDITYQFIENDKLTRYVPDPSSDPGSTFYYTLWANKLKLYPVPSDVRTIFLQYIKKLTALADNDTTTWEIPDKYDPIVINGVMTYIYKFDPELGAWDTQHQLYESGIARMIVENASMIGNLGATESHRNKNILFSRETTTSSPLL